ncbi:MAG: hypothetical protein CMA91_03995 [Euryarchaeota archaeon]|nr:hypothetical protein [Euryarchaeota archaeon]
MGEVANDKAISTFQERVTIISNSLIIIAILCIAMIHLESVLKPFFIALGIYFVLKPGADYLSKNSFPVFLSYLTMLLLFILIITSAAFFAWSQVQGLVDDEDKQSEYDDKLNQRWKQLKKAPLIGSMINDASSSDDDGDSFGSGLESLGIGSGGGTGEIATSVVSSVGAFITTSITVLFFLIFIIFEAHLLPGRIERAWPNSSSNKMEAIQHQIEEGINTYIIVKTGCGIGSAIIAAIVMMIFGIDLWFVWAVLTFILNYVPYIGSLIATIPPLVIGLILLKPIALIVLTIILLVNQQVWGNYIETKWAGRALDLSPVILLLITAFSFWLWGIVGMVLAVPLFAIVKIVLENIEETRPIAILLSERAPTLKEAWQDALRDGNLSVGEYHKLTELQKRLGVSDKEVTRISGISAIKIILQRGRARQNEIDFVMSASVDTMYYDLMKESLTKGRIDSELREDLEKLKMILTEEE